MCIIRCDTIEILSGCCAKPPEAQRPTASNSDIGRPATARPTISESAAFGRTLSEIEAQEHEPVCMPISHSLSRSVSLALANYARVEGTRAFHSVSLALRRANHASGRDACLSLALIAKRA
ncbi:hypothetical protein EVAR_41307_1 [Eumeta japonica]|uniref:Uncharacterized protein n=1 Tax=Eumeta variegata TaxID=151549 RepID=A0A4C1X532_EUMVA|nr:hypothetical protein EVAR_41307_1 [Eumeta japonica]